jgi:hypothetical protein
MKNHQLLFVGLAALGVAACEGGGVELNTSTVDNSVDNSTSNVVGGGGSTNPCAKYTDLGGVERSGSFDGRNCFYGADFVGGNNPLRVDVTIPFISGVHIFEDKLFVGESVDNRNPGVAVPQDGEGPTLTIQAGNTLAWTDAADYLLVNRGSRIIANGSATAPITLTGFTDAVTGTAGPEDVQLWGGFVINGNGITNNCTDQQRTDGTCAVVSEGQPTFYGGNNNAESSGELRYVVVKHAGFEVAPDDELNGLTLNAVGAGTVMENVQVYSTYDDGFEWFGGAASIKNAIAIYVRDDSLDFSDGYVGTVDTALAIQSFNDGNWCIELDNIGSSRSDAGQPFDLPPVTAPTVNNYTCIVSNSPTGTHGAAAGFRIRQGGRVNIENSLVYSGYANKLGQVGNSNNRCFRPESSTTLRDMETSTAANELVSVKNTVFGCEVVTSGALPGGTTFVDWLSGAGAYAFNSGNTLISDVGNANVVLLEPGTFYTAPALRDAAGNPIATPAGGLGGVTRSDDWTRPWAYGLRAGNRGQPLWFE